MNIPLNWRMALPGEGIWYDGELVELVEWEQRGGAEDETPTPYPVVRHLDGRVGTIASWDPALGARTTGETETRRERLTDFIGGLIASVEESRMHI